MTAYGIPVPPTTQIDVARFDLSDLVGPGALSVKVLAGNRGKERVVPPAGVRHAFERQRWARSVEVYVSPTGRSVRVFVDGVEIPR